MKKNTLWLSFVLMMFFTTINAQQDFESATVGALPTGWTSSQTASDDPGFTVQDENGFAHGGSQYLAHLGDDIATESTSWVVSSVQSISSGYELRFFWRGRWSSSYNFTGVYISTASNDPVANPGDFTLLEELSPANYPATWLQWNEAAYDLSAYSGQVYVAFKYVGDRAHDFFIDDVSVAPMPYCELPSSIDIDNRYTDSLDISWGGVTGYENYEVVWGAPGFDPNASGVSSAQVTAVNNNYTYTITGLSPSTQYEVYVRTACSSYNYSTWIGPELGFTSGPPPANDDCDNAIALTVNADASCGVVTSGTTLDATASPQPDDVTGTPNNDVWFSFVATNTTHIVSLLNIVAVIGSSTSAVDMGMGLYDGSGGCSALTLVDDSDPNSMVVSGLTVGTTYFLRVYGWYSSLDYAQTFDVCVGTPPPPPANDLCVNAIPLTVYNSLQTITGNNYSATDSGETAPGCAYYSGGDLWYSVVVPASGSFTAESASVSGSDISDTGLAVYSGSCGNLTLIECNDDIGYPNYFSSVSVTGATPGDTMYIRVWEYGNNSFGELGIGVYDASVSVEDNMFEGFNYYPNPVTNIFNISAKHDIQGVSIFDITGKQVVNVKPNSLETRIDFSSLQSGVYFVKARVADKMTAFKIVKK